MWQRAPSKKTSAKCPAHVLVSAVGLQRLVGSYQIAERLCLHVYVHSGLFLQEGFPYRRTLRQSSTPFVRESQIHRHQVQL